MIRSKLILVHLLIAAACAYPRGAATAQEVGLVLTSPAFEQGAEMPTRHTAYGENLSPELRWDGVPTEVESFAIILDDSSAPGPSPFVHWVVYNIPGEAEGLPEGIQAAASVPSLDGAFQGPNGVHRVGYFGPRPPPGDAHLYNFRLFALRSAAALPDGLDRDSLMEAIRPHIVAAAVLSGTYRAR